VVHALREVRYQDAGVARGGTGTVATTCHVLCAHRARNTFACYVYMWHCLTGNVTRGGMLPHR
jgi:hypothetical protein